MGEVMIFRINKVKLYFLLSLLLIITITTIDFLINEPKIILYFTKKFDYAIVIYSLIFSLFFTSLLSKNHSLHLVDNELSWRNIYGVKKLVFLNSVINIEIFRFVVPLWIVIITHNGKTILPLWFADNDKLISILENNKKTGTL